MNGFVIGGGGATKKLRGFDIFELDYYIERIRIFTLVNM